MSHDATLEMFFEEAADLVRDCEAALLRLEQASSEPDPGLVNRIFRNVHTLKGSSAMLGFDRLAGVAHALEDRSEEHTSELQSRLHLVCRLLLEKKKKQHLLPYSHSILRMKPN